ncbi:hypothetical protein [Streptomyces sp. NBC_01304]|uniref:hypothetical protein n=1 Tax=Streptomyces sp. NBC_01304 TaxID=2903818 RepID=UPI002E0E01F4|nr:hypothetical protein OG430_00750 [Streptomyces sp. NBC_01304]
MADLNDGMYHISLKGEQFLSQLGDSEVILFPESSRTLKVEVKNTEDDLYTFRHNASGQYLTLDRDPQIFAQLVLGDRRAWRVVSLGDAFVIVADHPTENLSVGLDPRLEFPPKLALSPLFERDRAWTFHDAK